MASSIPSLIATIENLLPQTQCERCGYKGCRPYAEAVVRDQEAIHLCQPGGQETADRIATYLNRPKQTVVQVQPNQVAVVSESECIGCTKCIQACPVDAIVGSSKNMHTILESDCTGCGLCLPPCPTLCISLQPLEEPQPNQGPIANARAFYFKQRFIARKERLNKMLAGQQKAIQQKAQVNIKEEILKSLSRVQAKRTMQHEPSKTSRDI